MNNIPASLVFMSEVDAPLRRHLAGSAAHQRGGASALRAAGGRPLVVTCRTAEYEQAILRGGVTLASATILSQPSSARAGTATTANGKLPGKPAPGGSGRRPGHIERRRAPRSSR